MAGTLFGLPLSQQFNENGDLLRGCKLYIYNAGTSTPATSYEDFDLTVGLELSHPIVANTAGRLPQFWLADGSYRARLTDAGGSEVFDIPSMTALGASSGTSSGGGVAADAIFQTGDFIFTTSGAVRSGWVFANGRTIGSSSSGATERANADCEDLFTWLWDNHTDTVAPVVGGRGANAAADWAANKQITLIDMRGKAAYGDNTMGNTSNGAILDADLVGVVGTATLIFYLNPVYGVGHTGCWYIKL